MYTDFWILIPVGLLALAQGETWSFEPGRLKRFGCVPLILFSSVLLYKPGGLHANLCYLQLTHLTNGAPNTLGNLPCSISYQAQYRGCRHAHAHACFMHTRTHTHRNTNTQEPTHKPYNLQRQEHGVRCVI